MSVFGCVMCDMDEERKEKKIVGFTLELSPAYCWVMGSVYGIITSVVTSKRHYLVLSWNVIGRLVYLGAVTLCKNS
jgi:hypothetical protein